MKYVHFVVHERIDGLFEDWKGDEVARRVDEQTAIAEQRLVLDLDRQCEHVAVPVLLVAGDRLVESFQAPHEAHVMFCFDVRVRI